MYFKLRLYLISFLMINGRSEIITKDPYTVISYPGLEELYLELRKQDPHISQRLIPEVKDVICGKIFGWGIPTIVTRSFEVALKPGEIEHRLRNEYPMIFLDLFEIPKPVKILDVQIPGRQNFRLANRSKDFNVYIDGHEYPEKTFTCVVAQYSPDVELMPPLKQYHVSDRTYNTNEVADNEYIVGRFLFTRNGQDHLIVHALAEGSSPLLTSQPKEQYLRSRSIYSPMFYAKHDPVCNLDHGRRLRVCTSVSLVSRGMSTGQVHVGTECLRKSIYLSGQSRRYDEWTIICDYVTATYHDELYVSRGYKHNEILVFKSHPTRDQLSVLGYQRKISTVVDTQFFYNFDDVED